jgi:hypothetical protein
MSGGGGGGAAAAAAAAAAFGPVAVPPAAVPWLAFPAAGYGMVGWWRHTLIFFGVSPGTADRVADWLANRQAAAAAGGGGGLGGGGGVGGGDGGGGGVGQGVYLAFLGARPQICLYLGDPTKYTPNMWVRPNICVHAQKCLV